jgi:hypothetical protein
MRIKRLVLTAVAAAMPLTALAAAPASASDRGGYDNDPEVSVYAYGHNVRVNYTCYTERHHGDDHGDYARGRDRDDHDKYGSLTTYYRGYRSWTSVRCDGYEHSKTYYVHGHGEFKAVLRDADGDKAYDSDYVKKDRKDHDY